MAESQDASTTRPRKSPSQARSRATIDAVLSAAAHILEAGGGGGFNTNAVAERAGVSIGSLYQYFPNKDAILVALIERRTAAFADSLADMAAAAPGDSLAEDLRSLLLHAIAWHDHSHRLHFVLDEEERRLELSLNLEPAFQRMHLVLVGLLARHRQAIGCEDLDKAAQNIGLIAKTLMEAESEGPSPDWPLATERVVGAMMGYLTVRPAGAPPLEPSSRLPQSSLC